MIEEIVCTRIVFIRFFFFFWVAVSWGMRERRELLGYEAKGELHFLVCGFFHGPPLNHCVLATPLTQIAFLCRESSC